MSDDAGRLIGGRFVLRERLDRGPQASTWLADDGKAGGRAVVKLAVDDGTWGVAREVAVAQRRITHPCLARTLAAGGEGRDAWIATRFVAGETLAEAMSKGPLEPAAAASVGSGVAGALGALHAGGVVHRDVRPANVMVPLTAGRHGWNYPTLIDLGIAGWLRPDGLTDDAVISGTPRWAAPEQLEGRRQGPATDVWGLGLVMHAMLTGRPPRRPSEGPRDVRLEPEDGVPEAVASLVRRCLIEDMAARPGVGEVARGLRAAAGATR